MKLVRRRWKLVILFIVSCMCVLSFIQTNRSSVLVSLPLMIANAVGSYAFQHLYKQQREWRSELHKRVEPRAGANNSLRINSEFYGSHSANITSTRTNLPLHDESGRNKTTKRTFWNKQIKDSTRRVQNISFDICREARFLPVGSQPMIALASVPGSGNTWVRYLLERASGFYTGSVYMDTYLFNGGFKGEFSNPTLRNTIIVKTHDTGTADTTKRYTGAVVIVRNPYNTILSYANLVQAGHMGWSSENYFKSEKWNAFVKSASVSWEDRITTWIRRSNVKILFYEKLKSDLRNQIIRLLRFLKVPIDDQRLDCMEANAEGSFHRKKKATKNGDFNPFTEGHKVIIDEHVRHASDDLRKRGYIDYDLRYTGLSR